MTAGRGCGGGDEGGGGGRGEAAADGHGGGEGAGWPRQSACGWRLMTMDICPLPPSHDSMVYFPAIFQGISRVLLSGVNAFCLLESWLDLYE